MDMYTELLDINTRPGPFEFYSAPELWTDEHTSRKMLAHHLDENTDIASRKGPFIEASVQWIMEHFALHEKSRVIDFGSGPGLYTNRFAGRGVRTTGIDFSKRSIEYARRMADAEKLPVDYIHADYLEHEPRGHYDLITMIMCDFCALSPVQRRRMLAKFAKALLPGGSMLLDVYSLTAYDSIAEKTVYEFNQLDNFWSPDDYYAFVNTFKYDAEKAVLDKYTIIERSRRRTIYNWLQYFSAESIRREFRENGLKIVEFFSDVSGAEYREGSPEFAVVAVHDTP